MARLDHLEAYHLAIDLVKKAGFKLAHVARRSESCYYCYPGLTKLIRLSAHKSSKRVGLGGVVASLSFPPKDIHNTDKGVVDRVAITIGAYFLTEPRSSEYKGPKGTWENDNDSRRINVSA